MILAPLVRRMRERIQAMEQSRFWMLRNRFFEMKKWLRLSAEGAWPPFKIAAAIEDAVDGADPYTQWLRLNVPRPADLARMSEVAQILPLQPRFTLLYVAADVSAPLLSAGIDSLSSQIYRNWELCVALPRRLQRPFRKRAAGEARVVVADDLMPNGERNALAAGLAAATGDYIGFLGAGDVLADEAFFEVALLLNRHTDADIVYSDEDTFGADGNRYKPYFKPDWSPELLLSRMYIGDLCFYRRALIERAAAAGIEPDGSMRYGVALRVTEQTERIYHIPRVLYHRLAQVAGTENDASDGRALSAALARRGEPGRVVRNLKCARTFIIRYEIVRPGRVSIIVPTREHGGDVDRCLASIFSHDASSDIEVVLVDNGSTEPDSLAAFSRWPKRDRRVRVVRDEGPFNFSALNNRAVRLTSGRYLLFLNNDTEVLTDDWLPALVEQAQRPAIGAVGARLLFPDGAVQHAGVILGIGGVAGHSHRLAERDAAGYFCAIEAVTNYSALTAACLMVRRSVFDEVGGFDEALTVAFNDVDLCLRFRARGYRNVYLPHVVLTHAESKTRGLDIGLLKTARSARERLLMQERWAPQLANDPYYNPHLTRRTEDYAIRVDELLLGEVMF